MSQLKRVVMLGPTSLVFSHICNTVNKACDLQGIAPIRVLKEYHKKNSPKSQKAFTLHDEIVLRLLLEAIGKYDRCLIYGYPLSNTYAKKFFESMKLDAFIHLSIDYDYVIKDFDDRYFHLPTSTDYHLKYNKPPAELIKNWDNKVFVRKPLKTLDKFNTGYHDSVRRNSEIADYLSTLTKTLKIDNAEDYESAIPKIIDFIKEE